MTYTYDGSFHGLLSVIFECYNSKIFATAISKENSASLELFGEKKHILTNSQNAERVLKGLRKKVAGSTIGMLQKALLSEIEAVPMAIWRYVRYIFENLKNVEDDTTKDFVIYLRQVSRKVERENHRIHAFVRFQQTKDGLYAATVEPDFDVLPITGRHFQKRYPSMRWLIYDVKRKYGIYHEPGMAIVTIKIENFAFTAGRVDSSVLSEKEAGFQQLWKGYFDAVNIPERKNPKLHLQHLPKRYWKYLPEKHL